MTPTPSREALPTRGLLVAYDFDRTNYMNWSEDFTQASWNKAGCVINPALTLGSSYRGNPVSLQHYTATNGNQSGNGLTSASAFGGLSVTAGQLVYASVFAAPGTGPSCGIVISSGATHLLTIFNFSTRTFSDAAGTSAFSWYEELPGGVFRLVVGFVATGTLLLRTHVGYVNGTLSVYLGGACLALTPEYERTSDGQFAADRSVRTRPLPPARMNLLNWTEDFSNAVWFRSTGTTMAPAEVNEPTTGAPAWRMMAGNTDPYVMQGVTTGNPSGLTITYSCWVKGEGVSVGRRVCFYSYGGSGAPEQVATSPTVMLTGEWQYLTYTRTFPAGMTSTFWQWRIDLEIGTISGDTMLIAAPQANLGSVALPYERQTVGTPPDYSALSANLMPANETFGIMGDASFSGTRSGPVTRINVNNTTGSTIAIARQWIGTPGSNSQAAARVSLRPGVTYAMRGRVRTPGLASFPAGATIHFGFHIFRNGTYVTEGGPNVTPSEDFRELLYTYTVPEDGGSYTAHPRLVFYNIPAGTQFSTEVRDLIFGEAPLGPSMPSSNPAQFGTSPTADANDPIWSTGGLSFAVDDQLQTGIQHTDQVTMIIVSRATAAPANAGGNLAGVALKDVSGPVTNMPYGIQFDAAGTYFAQIAVSPANPPTADAAIGNASIGPGGQVGQVVMTAMTYDGRRLQTYFNGAYWSGATLPGVLSYTNGYFRVGQQKIGMNRYFTGTVHFAAVYDRALSPREIALIYRVIKRQLNRKGVPL